MLKLIYLIMQQKLILKNATRIDTSKLAAKYYVVSLKAKLDKLDIDKLIPVPVDLSKQSTLVKNDVVKKLYMINQSQK